MNEEGSETTSESEIEVEEQEDRFSARPYQVELLERAMQRNTIVCLGTGTGKTFISVMLIKELAHEVRQTYKKGGKRTFFLVNTGTRFYCLRSIKVYVRGGVGFRNESRVV